MIYAPKLRYMDEFAPGLSPEFRSSSINAQYHMISTSTGIVVLPCFIGDSSKELVRILPDDVAITRTFWMVIHRVLRHLARFDACVRWLRCIVTDERSPPYRPAHVPPT